MGGNIGLGNFTDAGRKYLPYSNSWTIISNMNVPAGYACGASYNNKVYVIGGYSNTINSITNANRIYNSVTDSWSLGAIMPIPSVYYAMGVYHDSLFYYIGGSDGTFTLSNVQIYNAASDTWSMGTNIPNGLSGAAGGISGNKIVVSGGYDNIVGLNATTYLGEIDPSDPTNINWTLADNYPIGPCSGLAGGASLDQSSGLVVFTGGALNGQTPLISSKYTFAYDVNSNQWKLGPNMITPANNLQNLAAVVHNDSLYMATAGGYGTGNALNVNEWLNMGPYQIPTGFSQSNSINVSFTCYPNPFVNKTDIEFSLTKSSYVKVIITDVVGQEVEVLCNESKQAGFQHLQWDAEKFANGIYFCKLLIDENETTQKLVKY
jgi:hypothetical protein